MSGSHRTGRRQLRLACLDRGHTWWPKDREWERCETCGALRRRTTARDAEPCTNGTTGNEEGK